MGVFLLKLKWIKCCPIPYSLPLGFSANVTARHGVPSLFQEFQEVQASSLRNASIVSGVSLPLK